MRVKDRLQLPLTFDVARLKKDLATVEQSPWTPHFVQQNYEGDWSAIPLSAPAGTADLHPIARIVSPPGCTDFEETEFLRACPYFQEVLAAFGDGLLSVRLMKLAPGSKIKEHEDYDLAFEEGVVRLHVPIQTNPDVYFYLNGERVVMNEGESWYLRLTDPHRVENNSDLPRVHMVIDAPVTPRIRELMNQA